MSIRKIGAHVLPLMMLASAGAMADLPEERFTLARMAIEEAQEVDADATAGSELMLAESKYQEAIENNERGREEVAERLLVQAMLHAEHAEVEGMQEEAGVAFTELNSALRNLEIELGRR
ncbi:MAG: hypothetical protein RLZZ227_727 [Pseudomonadota bacterium]|jgi:hypothetical protein